jgi:hypothetical protein
VQSILEFLSRSVESPITLWSSIAITLVFFYEFIRHLTIRIGPVKKRFDHATQLLSTKLHPDREEAQQAPPLVDAAELFPRSPRLRERWTQFLTTWIKSVPEGETQIGSVDIDRYFTLEEALGDTSYLRKVESIPGRLLSLGILGTFIGLAYGVNKISGTSDSATMMSEVLGLVSGLSVAFITSILGILYSLIFLVSEKAYVGEATNSILSFRLAARALYPVLEPEIALVQIARYTEQQADSLRTLENDLAATLSESFGGAVQEHLAPLIEQIHETVSRATDASAQVQIEGVQKIIDGFMTGMNEQLGSNFQQLGSSIEQASTNLGDLTERLEVATASQAAIMEKTTQTAEVLERQLPALLSFGERLDHAANRFNEAIENIAALEEALSAGTKQLIEVQQSSEARFTEVLGRLDESSKLINATASAQIESQERMEQAYKDALESFEHGVREGLVQSLTSFDSVLSDVLERFSGTLADLKEQYDQLNKHSQALKDGAELVSTQIAANLVEVGEASTQAHSRIKELSESYLSNAEQGLETSTTTIKQLESAATEIALSLSDLQKGVERIASKVEEAAQTLENQDTRGSRFPWRR